MHSLINDYAAGLLDAFMRIHAFRSTNLLIGAIRKISRTRSAFATW